MRRTAMMPPCSVSPSHDHRDRHTIGYPSGDRHALGHRCGADIGKTGIGTNDAAGTDKQRLATGLLHDPGMRRSRWVEDRQDSVSAMDQFLQGAPISTSPSRPLRRVLQN
jgi:hypothetical protein